MIHIVTALPCEAKPLIQRYELNGKQQQNGFRIYESSRENDPLRLIISGLGKTASAAATAYLQGLNPDNQTAWLNFGVAGHASLPIGSVVLASKISDTATNTHWYPPLTFRTEIKRAGLISVDQPEHVYNDHDMFDMEAAGFYTTANRFNTTELVQVCKVISDNKDSPADNVTPQQVEEIIRAGMEEIDGVIQALKHQYNLCSQQTNTEGLEAFKQHWHFSVSQQHQLQRLLQRWKALTSTTPAPEQFDDARNSKAVIKALQQQLETQPLNFGEDE